MKKSIIYIAGFVILSPIYLSGARSEEVFRPYDAILAMVEGHFGSAITTGTRLKTIFVKKPFYLFYYTNENSESKHVNEHLLVFKNRKYYHDYYLLQTCNFKVVGKHLICHFTDFPGEVETNLLSDVFTGKKIVIGGSEERPWRGSRTLYR